MSLPQIFVPKPAFNTSEFQVNTYSSSYQSLPNLAGLTDGGWVSVWMSEGQDGSGYGVYGQRYDAGGVKTGGEFKLSTTTVANQWFPAVAALTDGGWVAIWMSDDGDGFGIYGQRYGADGLRVGTEFRANTTLPLDQGNPSVLGLPDGGWLVLWDSQNTDTPLQGIYGQRYNASGVATGGEFQLDSFTDFYQWYPNATLLADGGWVAIWMSYQQDGSGQGIYGQRFDASGNSTGGEFRVNSTTASDQWFPSVAALDDGGWVVVWMSNEQDGSANGIYGQRYAANGTAVGGEFRVNTTADQDQSYPSVTAMADGGWMVAWGSLEQDGSGYGIYTQRFAANGTTYGPETLINTTTALDQRVPNIVGLADGSAVVTWESVGQDGSESGVIGRLLSLALQLAQPDDFIEDNALYADGSLITDPNGVGPISWQWQRSTTGGDSWTDIAGATSDRYQLDDADVDTLIRLRATYQDGLNATRQLFSAASTPVINVNDTPVDYEVILSGKPEEGALLTALASVAADEDGLPAPLTFSYQWQTSDNGTSWSNLAGQTASTFSPGAINVGDFLRVQVSYVDGQGTTETVFSAPTPPVFAAGTSFLVDVNVVTVKGAPLVPELTFVEYNDSGELFLRPSAIDGDTVSYELVARPAATSGSVAFELAGESALLDFALAAPLGDWTLTQTTPDANTVNVSGDGAGDGSNHLAADTEVVLADYSLDGLTSTALLSGAVGGRAATAQVLGETPMQSFGGGAFNGVVNAGGSGLLNGQLAYENSSRAIGAQDALEALRLALGLQTTQGTANAYDYIAADFNRDGRVGAQDALDILRYALGFGDAIQAQWVFVDASEDLSSISRLNVFYDKGSAWSDINADDEISLVGILLGDVNDSFNPV